MLRGGSLDSYAPRNLATISRSQSILPLLHVVVCDDHVLHHDLQSDRGDSRVSLGDRNEELNSGDGLGGHGILSPRPVLDELSSRQMEDVDEQLAG